jgi:hypothetical protein
MNKTKAVHLICECSESTPRYRDLRTVRLPFANTLTMVIGVFTNNNGLNDAKVVMSMYVGHIDHEELEEIKGERRKRIFIGVTDVIFLSTENTSTQSPRMTIFL